VPGSVAGPTQHVDLGSLGVGHAARGARTLAGSTTSKADPTAPRSTATTSKANATTTTTDGVPTQPPMGPVGIDRTARRNGPAVIAGQNHRLSRGAVLRRPLAGAPVGLRTPEDPTSPPPPPRFRVESAGVACSVGRGIRIPVQTRTRTRTRTRHGYGRGHGGHGRGSIFLGEPRSARDQPGVASRRCLARARLFSASQTRCFARKHIRQPLPYAVRSRTRVCHS
jgi:hypothetical protein